MTLNGENITLKNNITLSRLLQDNGFDVKRVAVVLNGEIVSRLAFDKTVVSDGDKLEVVHFVGGG